MRHRPRHSWATASHSAALALALILAAMAVSSAFVSTTSPSMSTRLCSEHNVNHRSARCSLASRERVSRRRSSPIMTLEHAAQLLPFTSSTVSGVVVQAHAHLAGSGVGMLLLAEDSDTPPNIYGKIALGGFGIAMSAVFGAYIVATIVGNMSTEELEKLNRDLAGGEELEELEAEQLRSQKRLAEIAEQMEVAKNPGRSLETAPQGVRERALEQLAAQTAAAAQNTDISSIEDEYGD